MKLRNHIAQVAHHRNSSGPMHDKRTPRGGSVNSVRDLLDEHFQEVSEGPVEPLTASFESTMQHKDEILDSDSDYQEWVSGSRDG